MHRAAPPPPRPLPWVLAAAALAGCAPRAPSPPSPPPPAEAAVTPPEPALPDPAAQRGAPDPDDPRDVVGKPAPGWELARWFNSPPLSLESLRGKVVLVRWFMSPECPYCSGTAPSLNRLYDDYEGRGLVVIGMYHHKRPEPLDPEDVKEWVAHYKFRFPVAIDEEWRTVKRWWLDGHERTWTSVSFLLDRRGVVRYVHKGGKYAPGDADYQRVQAEIEALLAEPG